MLVVVLKGDRARMKENVSFLRTHGAHRRGVHTLGLVYEIPVSTELPQGVIELV